jgi:hypothetical protein
MLPSLVSATVGAVTTSVTGTLNSNTIDLSIL